MQRPSRYGNTLPKRPLFRTDTISSLLVAKLQNVGYVRCVKTRLSMGEYDEYIEGWRTRLAKRQEAKAKRAEHLQEVALRCATHLAQRYRVERVYLFGSLAGGRTIHERTDIDLAVAGLQAKRYFTALTELWSFLPPDAELDLVPLEDARPTLREAILREGKLLYERKRLSSAKD